MPRNQANDVTEFMGGETTHPFFSNRHSIEARGSLTLILLLQPKIRPRLHPHRNHGASRHTDAAVLYDDLRLFRIVKAEHCHSRIGRIRIEGVLNEFENGHPRVAD